MSTRWTAPPVAVTSGRGAEARPHWQGADHDYALLSVSTQREPETPVGAVRCCSLLVTRRITERALCDGLLARASPVTELSVAGETPPPIMESIMSTPWPKSLPRVHNGNTSRRRSGRAPGAAAVAQKIGRKSHPDFTCVGNLKGKPIHLDSVLK